MLLPYNRCLTGPHLKVPLKHVVLKGIHARHSHAANWLRLLLQRGFIG